MVESSLQTALRAGPRAAGRWLLNGDLGNLRCVTALATVGLPWLLVRLWKKRKHAMMLQQRQAEETVGQRSTATVGRIDGTNGRVLTSTRQSESMRRDCLLRHEASERLSSGRREQVRADEAPVTELAAQLNSLENETKGGAPHEPSAAATNGAVPMEHVPVRRVDTFGASIDVARMSASAGNGRKASPLSHGVPGAAARRPQCSGSTRLASPSRHRAPPLSVRGARRRAARQRVARRRAARRWAKGLAWRYKSGSR